MWHRFVVRHRRVCLLPAVLILLLVLGATDAYAARTHVERVEPFGVNGRLAPGWAISATGSGSCFGGANATTRRDAYRCFLRNLIFDPCFVDPRGMTKTYVLCVLAPWRHRAVKIRLTQPLPTANSGKHAAAWALSLSRKIHCSLATGMGIGVVSGRSADWYCDNGGAVADPLHRGNPWWAWYAPRILGTSPHLSAKWRRVPIRSLYW
jgi:hypothetical protein